MRKRPRANSTDEQIWKNDIEYLFYYNRLMELAISAFKWNNLPDTIDVRFLELTLYTSGYAVFFKDEDLGYLGLQSTIGGRLNVYRIPIDRMAYSTNGYQKNLDSSNSVLIFNNLIRTNTISDIEFFAHKIWEVGRTIDVNVNAQKTPLLIQCDENQRLSLLQFYEQYKGNAPFIFGEKGLAVDSIKAIKTDAPYMCDKLYELKNQYWNEALTFLGISNINITKKERLISDEVVRTQGGTISSRYSRLEARNQACKLINKMYGLNVSVEYKDDYQIVDEDAESNNEEEGADNE